MKKRRLLIFLLFFLCLPSVSVSQVRSFPEYAMKAAFVYNFVLFAEWPELPDNTLRLCVMPSAPIKKELDQFISKQPHGAKLIITSISTVREVSQCQVLFISEDDLQNFPVILSELKEKPVLIVSDVPHLMRKGVMIGLSVESQRMVFEVDLKAVQQSGLHLSSKLLRLARKVF